MKALGFGAIVWDDIPPSKHLGGAVLNVLGHLCKLGAEAEMISALGTDSLGEETIREVARTNVGLRWTHRVAVPTCLVRVSFDENRQPSYHLDDDVSWDHVQLTDEDITAIRAEMFDVVCYGTLDQRSERSRRSLRKLLAAGGAKRAFCDVNLRPPFYSAEVIEYSLQQADIAKINLDEAKEICAMFQLGADGVESQARCLRERFGIGQLLLTAGEEGAYYASGGEFGFCPAYRVTVADPVGAGDAFSAGLLYRLGQGDSLAKACDFACRLGALIASKPSSLPEYHLEELGALKAISR